MSPRSARFRSPRARPGPSFAAAIERMRGGGLLRLTYIRGAAHWEIDDYPVSPEVVSLLLTCKEIVSTGDALFEGAMGQAWEAR